MLLARSLARSLAWFLLLLSRSSSCSRLTPYLFPLSLLYLRLSTTRYGNHEKKVNQFIACRDAVSAETSHVENLMHFRLYNFVQPREQALKKASYLVALITNLIMLFSMEQTRGHASKPVFKYLPTHVKLAMECLGFVQLTTSSIVVLLTLVVRGAY